MSEISLNKVNTCHYRHTAPARQFTYRNSEQTLPNKTVTSFCNASEWDLPEVDKAGKPDFELESHLRKGWICTECFDYCFQVQWFMSCPSPGFQENSCDLPWSPASAHQQCCLKGRWTRSQSIPNIVNGVNHLRAGARNPLSDWYREKRAGLQTHNTQVQMRRQVSWNGGAAVYGPGSQDAAVREVQMLINSPKKLFLEQGFMELFTAKIRLFPTII